MKIAKVPVYLIMLTILSLSIACGTGAARRDPYRNKRKMYISPLKGIPGRYQSRSTKRDKDNHPWVNTRRGNCWDYNKDGWISPEERIIMGKNPRKCMR